MDSVRTDDQKTADADLEAAIIGCLRAYGFEEDGEVLSDFVILCSASRLHNDGVVETTYPILLRDGDIPWYRILGLIEIHRTLAHRTLGTDNG